MSFANSIYTVNKIKNIISNLYFLHIYLKKQNNLQKPELKFSTVCVVCEIWCPISKPCCSIHLTRTRNLTITNWQIYVNRRNPWQHASTTCISTSQRLWAIQYYVYSVPKHVSEGEPEVYVKCSRDELFCSGPTIGIQYNFFPSSSDNQPTCFCILLDSAYILSYIAKPCWYTISFFLHSNSPCLTVSFRTATICG